jgi:molecular chaperone DnaK (HSP70)
MREAAMAAGFVGTVNSSNLVIATEPEAAALAVGQKQTELTPLAHSGGSFMVIDMGGGTIDMTIHEVQSAQLELKELTHRRSLPEVCRWVEVVQAWNILYSIIRP